MFVKLWRLDQNQTQDMKSELQVLLQTLETFLKHCLSITHDAFQALASSSVDQTDV